MNNQIEKQNYNNIMRLARANGLISGCVGAVKHVLVYECGLDEETTYLILQQVDKVMDETQTLITEVADDIKSQGGE